MEGSNVVHSSSQDGRMGYKVAQSAGRQRGRIEAAGHAATERAQLRGGGLPLPRQASVAPLRDAGPVPFQPAPLLQSQLRAE